VRVFALFKQECYADNVQFLQVKNYPLASTADVAIAYLDGEPLQYAKTARKVIFHQLINLSEPTGLN